MSAKKPNKWMVALSVTFGTLMGAIDASIVLGLFAMAPIYRVALPFVTTAGGSLLVAWSLDRLHDIRVLVVCALVGLVVPWLRRKKD